jgi:hypothetical protein
VDLKVPVTELPTAAIDRLNKVHDETDKKLKNHVAAGGVIPVGQRHDTIFHLSLKLAHEGLSEAEILPSMLAANTHCEEPLSHTEVVGQIRGAIKRARERPDPSVELRRKAAEILENGSAAVPESRRSPRSQASGHGRFVPAHP